MDRKIEYIKQVLLNLMIHNYHINTDYSVDVYGSVNIRNLGYYVNTIPIIFNKIYGDFYASEIGLTTLINSPTYVSGDFNCSHNYIESLEHCPKFIGGRFKVNNNLIKSLDLLSEDIMGSINISHNKLETLIGLPRYIDGDLDISYNSLEKIDVRCGVSGIISLKGNPFSSKLKDLNFNEVRELFEYGLDYNIFGNDGKINEKRLNSMLKEMNG